MVTICTACDESAMITALGGTLEQTQTLRLELGREPVFLPTLTTLTNREHHKHHSTWEGETKKPKDQEPRKDGGGKAPNRLGWAGLGWAASCMRVRVFIHIRTKRDRSDTTRVGIGLSPASSRADFAFSLGVAKKAGK